MSLINALFYRGPRFRVSMLKMDFPPDVTVRHRTDPLTHGEAVRTFAAWCAQARIMHMSTEIEIERKGFDGIWHSIKWVRPGV